MAPSCASATPFAGSTTDPSSASASSSPARPSRPASSHTPSSRPAPRPSSFPPSKSYRAIDRKAWRQALERLDAAEYDWLVFSSANGVDIFFDELRREKKDARALGRARVCAIGPATAIALSQHGIQADLVPERFLAEGVVEALAERGIMGQRVLWPRARGARRALATGLERLGATVDEVPLYSAAVPKAVDPYGMSRLLAGEINVVTFASPSAVRNLLKMLTMATLSPFGEAANRLHRACDGCGSASSGPARGGRSAGAHNRGATRSLQAHLNP